jgi:predicted P-loop ATPase
MRVLSESTLAEVNASLIRILEYSGIVKADGKKRHVTRCIFHKDDTPSVTAETKNGKPLWHCHGCGAGGDAIAWVKNSTGLSFEAAVLEAARRAGLDVKYEDKDAPPPPEPKIVARYRYVDEAGKPVFSIERWEPALNKIGKKKSFVQRLADGTAKKSDVQFLYNLPAILADKTATVWLVEGEKCADALNKLGLVATTWAGGSSVVGETWVKLGFTDPLKGRNVVIIPDNDEVGVKAMKVAEDEIRKVAASCVTIKLDVKKKGDDVVEWIAAGGTRAALEAMAEKVADDAAEWKEGLAYYKNGGLKPTAINTQLILEHDAEIGRGLFAMDTFRNQIMLTRRPPFEPHADRVFPSALTDNDVTRASLYFERKYEIAPHNLGALITETADRNRYNPLTDWLNGLVWDGKSRLSTWCSRLLGSENTRYSQAIGRAWCISAVARAMRRGCQVDTTIVFEGPQGCGKSSALRTLVGDEYFLDHIPDFTSKDAALLISAAWVHELAELATLNRTESEKIKQFLSQREDVYRPPYGKMTINVPRSCVFAATTNKDEYLKDLTGNRRFWPLKVVKADLAAIAAERDQIWAEAVAAFKAGEAWDLRDAEIIADATEAAAARVDDDDPWADLIGDWADAQVAWQETRTTVKEILKTVLFVPPEKQSNRDGLRVKNALKKFGFVQKRSKHARFWARPAQNPDDFDSDFSSDS